MYYLSAMKVDDGRRHWALWASRVFLGNWALGANCKALHSLQVWLRASLELIKVLVQSRRRRAGIGPPSKQWDCSVLRPSMAHGPASVAASRRSVGPVVSRPLVCCTAAGRSPGAGKFDLQPRDGV